MKIAFFALSNFLDVQGATEPYYVYKHFSRSCSVIAFVCSTKKISPDSHVFGIKPWPRLPTFIAYNLKILPYLFSKAVRSVDIIYTYKGVITPILVWKLLFRRKWVCDFRTSPVAQELEFRRINKALSPFRRGAYAAARLFYRLTLRYCDLVVAISEEVKQELIDGYNVPEERIHLQPLGVNLELFKPQSEPPGPKEGLRLVYIGAIVRQRGLDVVLQALSKLKEQGIPAQFIVVGRGPATVIQELKGLAEELSVSDRVVWRGYVPHEEIPRILEACHIALSPLPPLQAYEVSSPGKIFEYLAMKKVVIATDILAHRKIIRHGENGLLVPPQDPEALAQAIASTYHDDALRRRLAKNARESVKSYDWNRMLAELERRVRELAH